MKKLKNIDYKILAALMKNAKMSDRQIAKQIDVSQPTVTRRRARLEKEVLDGYTAIPKWAELGYGILAFTFIKSKQDLWLQENYATIRERARKWLMNQPNVLMSGGCRGMGMNGFILTVHKSYSDFDNFQTKHRIALGDMITDIESIVVNLKGEDILKPLQLKYLVDAE